MTLFLTPAFPRRSIGCALLLALSACGGNTTEPVIRTPTQLQKLSGDGQIGIAGEQLASPLVVEVKDAQGNPVAEAVVTFGVSQGGGNVGTSTASTGGDGRASTTFTTGQVAGAPQLVAASVTSASLSAVFTATTTAGPPASIAVSAGSSQQAAPGTAVPTAPTVVVRDANENPVAGVTVTFEVVSGGGSITGGSAVTNNNGLAQVGGWTLGSGAEPNVLRATAAGAGISGNPVTFTATVNSSAFEIAVRFLSSATTSQRQAVAEAQAKWESLITGDLEDVPVTANAAQCGPESPAINETVDDLLIFMTIEPIDGPGEVLASAGPCFIRTTNSLTAVGAMRFDSEDLADIETEGLLTTVILHEMGHVLGFGSLWGRQGLLADPSASGGTDPHFTGTQAIAAFNEVGGTWYAGNKVPVENVGGVGRADGHWRESVMVTELMTGLIDPGQNPLSRVTVASLADQGYAVNLGGADMYSLSLGLQTSRVLPGLELGNDRLVLPIKKLDAAGRVVGVFQP